LINCAVLIFDGDI